MTYSISSIWVAKAYFAVGQIHFPSLKKTNRRQQLCTLESYVYNVSVECGRHSFVWYVSWACFVFKQRHPFQRATQKNPMKTKMLVVFYQMKWKLWNFCFCSSWVYLFCVDRGTIEIDGKIIPYQNEWFNCCVNIIYSYASVCVLISLYLLLWDLFPIFIISHLKLYEVKATV